MTDEQRLPTPEQKGQRVRVVGDHPHRGASGTVRDDLPMKLGMWLVELDHGAIGESGCYAGPEHLRRLPASEDPRA